MGGVIKLRAKSQVEMLRDLADVHEDEGRPLRWWASVEGREAYVQLVLASLRIWHAGWSDARKRELDVIERALSACGEPSDEIASRVHDILHCYASDEAMAGETPENVYTMDKTDPKIMAAMSVGT